MEATHSSQDTAWQMDTNMSSKNRGESLKGQEELHRRVTVQHQIIGGGARLVTSDTKNLASFCGPLISISLPSFLLFDWLCDPEQSLGSLLWVNKVNRGLSWSWAVPRLQQAAPWWAYPSWGFPTLCSNLFFFLSFFLLQRTAEGRKISSEILHKPTKNMVASLHDTLWHCRRVETAPWTKYSCLIGKLQKRLLFLQLIRTILSCKVKSQDSWRNEKPQLQVNVYYNNWQYCNPYAQESLLKEKLKEQLRFNHLYCTTK